MHRVGHVAILKIFVSLHDFYSAMHFCAFFTPDTNTKEVKTIFFKVALADLVQKQGIVDSNF